MINEKYGRKLRVEEIRTKLGWLFMLERIGDQNTRIRENKMKIGTFIYFLIFSVVQGCYRKTRNALFVFYSKSKRKIRTEKGKLN